MPKPTKNLAAILIAIAALIAGVGIGLWSQANRPNAPEYESNIPNLWASGPDQWRKKLASGERLQISVFTKARSETLRSNLPLVLDILNDPSLPTSRRFQVGTALHVLALWDVTVRERPFESLTPQEQDTFSAGVQGLKAMHDILVNVEPGDALFRVFEAAILADPARDAKRAQQRLEAHGWSIQIGTIEQALETFKDY
ncbi:MAG: hypothetical protein PF961_01585 [Planctomycetota bacterium]|jgi:hypothetical protein|nr:hypothetical protein [Planctomycetota bacterium]